MTKDYQAPVAIPVGHYPDPFPVQPEISHNMIECYSLGRTVKILCGINIFFNLFYSFYNPYFLIPAIVALTGYYGAKHYNACITLVYLIL